MSWRTAHASEVGTSHIDESIPCQDCHVVDEAGEHLIVAVADGAGSAERAERGAQIACSVVVGHLKTACQSENENGYSEELIESAFQLVRSEIELEAAHEQARPRSFASTLLVAVIGPQESIFGQVGDGAAVFDTGSGLELTHWPEQDAINITDFVTSGSLSETLTITRVQQPVQRLAMMTDGLTHLLLDFRNKAPYVPAIERLLNTCLKSPDPASLNEHLRDLLRSEVVNDKSDDDKTLVLACRTTTS